MYDDIFVLAGKIFNLCRKEVVLASLSIFGYDGLIKRNAAFYALEQQHGGLSGLNSLMEF